MTVEKGMQLIKGRFLASASHELGYKGEVWQRGFTEEQVMNRESFEEHLAYIANNPLKAGLADLPVENPPYNFEELARKKEEVLKAAQASRG